MRLLAILLLTLCLVGSASAQPTALDTLFAPEPCAFCGFGFSLDAAADEEGTVRLLTNERYRAPDGAAYVLAYDPATGAVTVEDSLGSKSPDGGLGNAVALTHGADTPLALLSNGGQVALWRRQSGGTWALEALLSGISKPGIGIPQFGSALAGTRLPSGEELVFVGAQNGGDDPTGGSREGSAYAFIRAPGTPPGPDAWAMEARLLAPDGEEGDRFGTAVALLPTPGLPGGHGGDALALVGADRHPRTDGHDGAVYVLARDGASGAWAFAEKITSSDLQNFDYFGSSVALLPLPGGAPGEALALVGATGDATGAPRSGSAYAFRREADASAPSGFRWVEEAKLLPERPGLGLAFGHAVALAADTLASGTPIAVGLVGASPSGETGSHPSEVGFYVRTVGVGGAAVWTRRATLATGAEGPEAADWFGHAVAFAATPSGPLALVGAYYSNAAQEQGYPDTGLAAGAVFVYDGRATVDTEPEAAETLPEAGTLSVRPNPARGQAEVRFTLAAPASVRVSAYDVLGRQVAVLHEGPMGAGAHTLPFDTHRLAPGTYAVVLEADGHQAARLLTVVR